MLFNSYSFILAFLPITIIGYFLFNRIGKYTLSKLWLLAASLFFYGFANIRYLAIISGSILINFAAGLLINHTSRKKVRLFLVAAGIIVNVALLIYFKYFDFLIRNLNAFLHTSFNLLDIILPIGISFFAFQQLAYLIDCYRGKAENYKFLDYALFVSFFPYVLSGPITMHYEMIPQFSDKLRKPLNFENFSKGLMALSFGLAKKVLIADTLGAAANIGFAKVSGLDSTNSILIMLCYTFQIYFDFSGYSDTVTGIGLMMNFDMPMNFNSPYRALNIIDFWKRWHITLTRFFTYYVYIPLGGSRKGSFRTYLNVAIIFLISGIWHGSNWTFLLWGAMHGAANIFTRLFQKQLNKIPAFFNWLGTFLFLNVTWVFFRAATISDGMTIIGNIFKGHFGPFDPEISKAFMTTELTIIEKFLGIGNLARYMPLILIILFLLFALFASTRMKNTNERLTAFRPTKGAAICTVILLAWSILSFSGVSTFLYTNF